MKNQRIHLRKEAVAGKTYVSNKGLFEENKQKQKGLREDKQNKGLEPETEFWCSSQGNNKDNISKI